MSKLTKRQQAEAIEKFGDALWKLDSDFAAGFDNDVVDRVCTVPNQEHIGCIARAFQRLGEQMQRECDEAEEADDRRRDNPFERDHRRLGQ
jgi:hypothetical protein